ncbi:tRNA (cytosine(38)-C(5))-methyltransferase [Patella vulgata]|uniref:tRNA (cytosine(38)-C(5))-methyltransferase n=1 Tax=Patella vulgata TaxID=6465 RepID=UPI00217FDFE6|nr:tRNA (cytosine(38)-C(5))-methyltransferase [Patella vulgata]
MAAPIELHEFRVLELYSGIGGMHYALKQSGVNFKVVTAIDINTTANEIYRHNIQRVELKSVGIEKITLQQFEKWNIDIILMSPPCQPFTRIGNKKDVCDIRTQSFLHVLDLIDKATNKPQNILVENVKGFELSEARQCLINTLQANSYYFQEFLLTPLQFGIPNCRLRYYLIAKSKCFNFEVTDMPITEIPNCPDDWLAYNHENEKDLRTNISVECESKWQPLENCEQNIHQEELEDHVISDKCLKLVHFLEKKSTDYFQDYLVEEKNLKWFIIMDIVHPGLKKTMCFTKRYGHYINGAGPIIQMSNNVLEFKDACELKSKTVSKNSREFWQDEEMEIIRRLKLRYFTPREVANLLCFPNDFDFPSNLNRIQLYRCLGNSLNVYVVSLLIKLMLM